MQSTFIQINKINSYGEVGVALVRVADIVGIKEKHVESEKLYDSNGNVVSETPKPKDFQVLVASERGYTEKYHVNESEYLRLVAELTK